MFLSLLEKEFDYFYEDEQRFKRFIGHDKEMFHLRENTEDHKYRGDTISLIQYIVDKELVQQQEKLIEVLISIDKKLQEKKNEPDKDETTEDRVIKQIKLGLESSPELDALIKSVQRRFPWSKWKIVGDSFLILFYNIVIGIGFYILDLFTDIQFTLKMFEYFHKDFTEATTECRKDFTDIFEIAIVHCKEEMTSDELCLESLLNATNTGEECFHQEQRFDNPSEWWRAGTISALHCALPFLFALFIWGLLLRSYTNGFKRKIFRLPLPPFTKIYKSYCNIKENSSKDDINKEQKKWKLELDIQAKIVIISMIIEAAIESGFQFWFQSIYLMPTLILSFIGIGVTTSWTDLFNWRLFSIAMSFYTFAWTFYNIRSETLI